jgi:hypothetical protein
MSIEEEAEDNHDNYIEVVFDALISAVNDAKKLAPTATKNEDFAIIEAGIDIAQVVVSDINRAAVALERIANVQEEMLQMARKQAQRLESI